MASHFYMKTIIHTFDKQSYQQL